VIINNWRELIQALRRGKYTSVGSYPVFFYTSNGLTLSFDYVLENALTEAKRIKDGDIGSVVVGCDVNWESVDLWCDGSNERIESAYAEPESE
jgi:hypothetical protein